jgi:hypothetical protein
MKCDTCKNKDYFDECWWPRLNCCFSCPCQTCEICEKPVKAMRKLSLLDSQEEGN